MGRFFGFVSSIKSIVLALHTHHGLLQHLESEGRLLGVQQLHQSNFEGALLILNMFGWIFDRLGELATIS